MILPFPIYMSTPSQIEANRLNALKSTGPRSAEGKETSRFNALKNGIEAESLVLPGEDPARLAALSRNYLVQFLPVGPVEERLVRSLTLSDWYQERFARIEAKIVALSIDPALDYETAVAMLYAGKDGNSLPPPRVPPAAGSPARMDQLPQGITTSADGAERSGACRSPKPGSPDRGGFGGAGETGFACQGRD